MQLEEEQASCNTELANPIPTTPGGKEFNEQATARPLQQRNYEWEIETEKLLEMDD